MQFKVPQFLEIEDKIFGPFSFREFVYLAGGAGLCFIIYKLLGFVLGAIPIILIGGFSAALTFYKPNNKPFINMIEAGLKYFTQNKLYIWKHSSQMNQMNNGQVRADGGDNGTRMMAREDISKLSGSKLRDLSWSLDVLDLSKQKDQSR
jgi:hypothetical protein